jgi:chromosome segregation ATPase
LWNFYDQIQKLQADNTRLESDLTAEKVAGDSSTNEAMASLDNLRSRYEDELHEAEERWLKLSEKLSALEAEKSRYENDLRDSEDRYVDLANQVRHGFYSLCV